MNRLFAVLGCLAMVPAANAHRLDECLQATRISIDITRVDLEIDLTPGVALASKVFGWIDTNRDGEISNAEGEAYAREMLGSVVLKVDDWPAAVKLVEASFPQFSDMSEGVGTIRLRATTSVPAAGPGRHQVSFLNMHRSEASVYLVNALVPANRRIQLGVGRRDTAQHGLTLEYTIGTDASSDPAFALLVALAMAGCLLLRHGHALRA